ncbi:DNRLRE domain-containing protein [Marinicella litoralis]|uniref:DNRLRE domain-containing protein n=1 Tax=Marinicella litoralis TaxID=644220 RepID=A0A4R6XQ17_9GAMM|nr:DNRLRE domain-containing protein [Marinicella litoralis]TDR19443.1 hypothetical protein C8D91_1999 [Marinicella litoralis]
MKTITGIILAFTSLNVYSDVLFLAANKDNTLYESPDPGLSNGAGNYFFVGRTFQGSNSLRRGLLQFDLSAIPNGSTINSVTLKITASRFRGSSQTINLHKVSQDWGEGSSDASGNEGGGTAAQPGDATWTSAFNGGNQWMTLGGDFAPNISASLLVDGLQTYNFASASLTSDVQNWVDFPTENFGWVLIGNESTAGTAYRFNARENSSTTPELTVDFTPPTLVTNPSKDNTLFETVDGSVSNGAGDKIFMGKPNNGLIRRGVLEFDVSSIPNNATITSASLNLTVTDIPGAAQSGVASLHLALSEWGEAGSSGNGQGAPSQANDATWIHRFFDTTFWNNPGGDFMPVASDTAAFDDQSTSITFPGSAELIADITTWIQDSNDNHGWVLIGDETNNGNVRSFASLEHLTAESRPTLIITYSLADDLIFINSFEQQP